MPAEAPEGNTWQEKTAIDIEPSAESWIGFEGYRRVAALYSGVTFAPFTNLRQDGFRLRAVAGQSLYRTAALQFDQTTQGLDYNTYTGSGRFLDLLAGWQMSSGGTTVKAFGGYGVLSNVIAPFDPETHIQGTARGAKAALEIWQNWSPSTWTSLDLADTQAHATYSVQLRNGVRLDPVGHPEWSVGPELAQVGNSETTLRRLGLFVRFESLRYEFTLSGGASRASNDAPMGYAAGQYLQRF